jgi:ABC-2 type transport system permease protein
MVSIVVMVGAGFLIGFRPQADVLGWIVSIGLLLLFAVAVTLVIDAVRNSFLGVPVGSTSWLAVLWWVGLVAVAVPVPGKLFRREVTRTRS